ncbi:ribosome hibernation factor-recruiting GTPase MRF [Williamsia herbipolensis]|uniref:ribosome hibernation factor-recruiting GTPase MRF n=1 Tax=Williamsia herbipolensis TaxID=1603258 RepID=UPI0005F87AD0|nr:GTP-binding protein [Williamsia herbipolensis]
MAVNRTPVVVVAGFDPLAVDAVASAMAVPGTVVVHHDLAALSQGSMTRTIYDHDTTGAPLTRVTQIDLVHGCVSCALREDLLPLLRSLHRRGRVERIVLALDPLVEPEPLCWAIDNVVVADVPGQIDGPAGRDVEIAAVIGCVDGATWLADATGDDTLAEAGLLPPDDQDERTMAQVAVGHVEFADALVVGAAADDGWQAARFGAVVARLAPRAPVLLETPQRPVSAAMIEALLAAVAPDARRGRSTGAHDPLLAGQPPLDDDCGVQIVEFTADRPMHPGRLHEAIDCLLDGVVCSRGRLWVATQPDEALWLESAGGGLRVATGGPWLATMTADEVARCAPERVSMASLRWHPDFGDRDTSIVVLVHRADPRHIVETLGAACLTDAEMAAGQAAWDRWPDPFGTFHRDPCADSEPLDDAGPESTDVPATHPREADRP